MFVEACFYRRRIEIFLNFYAYIRVFLGHSFITSYCPRVPGYFNILIFLVRYAF
jgi:hypothetical protein